jgi:hypothetical protein
MLVVCDWTLGVGTQRGLAVEIGWRKNRYDWDEPKKARKSSVKKPKPFLKEFEISVNGHSNIKVKTKSESDGGVQVVLKIGKEQDLEEVLGRVAELLVNC